jgi:hypothetical protein
MVLQGAEILFYPTAIGSEPLNPQLDSRDHWTRVMQVGPSSLLSLSSSSSYYATPYLVPDLYSLQVLVSMFQQQQTFTKLMGL